MDQENTYGELLTEVSLNNMKWSISGTKDTVVQTFNSRVTYIVLIFALIRM